ncbi:transferrin-binding protein-like solute binding protein [Ruegeria lacuscaerulensis]|uniref:transferrin-binding protein-like solute binding protein n=1 Tax=Ruegeria lacuscaerulensis TaxID=55218 RepID=UPI00148057A4|nr:transferrin-binding protein-like solute binding protein [Ruegeria lacuscaerulensis]
MILRATVATTLALSLAACGGGGGGSSESAPAPGTPSNPLPFDGFSKLQNGKTTRLTSGGGVRVIPFSQNADGTLSFEGTQFAVTSADLTPQSNGDRTIVFKQEGQPDISFGPNDATFSFYNGSLLVTKPDGTGLAVIADPDQINHEYQTYGAWLNTPDGRSGWANAGSFGQRTAASNVPTGTSATYSGNSVGIFATETGASGLTDSNVTVSTDFKSATLSSSDTFITDAATGVSNSAAGLDFSTTINDVEDGFGVGTISTPTQSGTASVAFYGPNAEEVGGEWGTSGSLDGAEFKYGAAFGAKR